MSKRYNTPHRTRIIKTRVTEEEHADFMERLTAYGMSQSEFIRQAITGATVKPIITVPPVNDEVLAAIGRLTGEYGKIGGNLNQIARYLNEYGAPYNTLAADVRAELSDLAALKFQVLREVGEAIGNSTFYIVIDYDKPTDEEGEQYETYFFSVVDEADLLAALEASGTELPECTCTEKCVAGAINMDCPVCSTNMTECVGVEPEPEPVEEPEPTPEPEPKQAGGNTGTLLLILAVALVGGGAGWYFKVYRPKQQRAAETEEDYGDELETYDDTPPWDEEDEDETEGDK